MAMTRQQGGSGGDGRLAERLGLGARREHGGDEGVARARVSRTAIAASVVPPGDVTFAQLGGASGDAAASAAEPAKVCSARRAPRAAARPICAPASSSASSDEEHIGRARSRQRRHGVEMRLLADPDSSPVGASSAIASARSLAVTAPRAYRPAMPWPISAGVFGIARTTRSLPVAATIASLRMPAMTLRCRAPATTGARPAAASKPAA